MTLDKPNVQEYERPDVLFGYTRKIKTGCGNVYVVLNKDEKGDLIEIIAILGKAGGCARANTEVTGRLGSGLLQSGRKPQYVIKQIGEISCLSSHGFGENRVLSCHDAIAKSIKIWLKEESKKNETI